MKKATFAAACVIFLVVVAPERSWSADAPVATPLSGVDEAAMAKSARASKLIGNKVYKGDTSIGRLKTFWSNSIMPQCQP